MSDDVGAVREPPLPNEPTGLPENAGEASRPASFSYKAAGVDIEAGNQAVDLIKSKVRSTFGPEVLTGIGGFGSLFAFGGYREPVLVASADGVGTKLKIAFAMDRHDSVGIDLVHHCVNDILTCGARPLFFLDYVALGKLHPEKVAQIVSGLAQGCRDAGCALVGGETAEMPGLYAPDDYDLAGFIVGAVERDRIVDGSRIQAGDLIWGLPSSGLHTNGYSLVRQVLKGEPLNREWPELGRRLGDELLEPHRCYLEPIRRLLEGAQGDAGTRGHGDAEKDANPPLPPGEASPIPPLPLGEAWTGQRAGPRGEGASSAGNAPSPARRAAPLVGRSDYLVPSTHDPSLITHHSGTRSAVDVRGMAHITGGGIPGNVSRIIPPGLKAVFHWGSWPVLPIFTVIQERGGVPLAEMLRVFNQGLGFVVICPPGDQEKVRRLVPEAMLVGEIAASDTEDRVEVVGV